MKTILIKRIVYRLVNKPLSLMGYKIINKNMHHLIDLEKFRVKTKIKTPEEFISFIFKKKNLAILNFSRIYLQILFYQKKKEYFAKQVLQMVLIFPTLYIQKNIKSGLEYYANHQSIGEILLKKIEKNQTQYLMQLMTKKEKKIFLKTNISFYQDLKELIMKVTQLKSPH